MRIEIYFRPKDQIRDQQLDDYYYKDDCLIFEIADTGNETFNKLILLHALVEELLTRYRGISEQEITQFDHQHLESEEPGLEVEAPYRDEHLFAEGIERLICGYLGIPWKEYELALE